MDKRNSKEQMLNRITRLEERVEAVYNAGLEGIEYVGASNYSSREQEAKTKLHAALTN